MSPTEKTDSERPPGRPDGSPGAPGKPATGCPCWWRRNWVWFAVVSVVAVIALGVVARMTLPRVLVAAGNRRLSRHFATAARLKGLDLGVFDCRFTVQNLTIKQPDGFGGDLFLDLPEARVNLALASLFASSLVIEEVMIADLSVHIARDRDGTLNVVRLLQPATAAPETAAPETATTRKPVYIKRIAVKNLTVNYTDSALNEEPIQVTVNRFDAVVTDVYLNAVGSGEHPLPGRAEMTGYLVQPDMTDAPLGIIARFGPIGTGPPMSAVHVATRLAGLELQPWRAWLPQGLTQVIGGDIVDLNLDAVMLPDMLDCSIAIVTPAGDALKLKVVGTPRRPQVDPDGIRGMVADRAREAGMNTLGNVGGTGKELARTALSSAAVAGKGPVTTVWATVTGLFETAGSVSKGDLAEGGAKLLDTMQKTVTNAGHTVEDTGASLTAGIVQTASAVGGGDRNQLWRRNTQQRWARSWEQARRSVAASSNPGHENEKTDQP